jgi:hypothetical protein
MKVLPVVLGFAASFHAAPWQLGLHKAETKLKSVVDLCIQFLAQAGLLGFGVTQLYICHKWTGTTGLGLVRGSSRMPQWSKHKTNNKVLNPGR